MNIIKVYFDCDYNIQFYLNKWLIIIVIAIVTIYLISILRKQHNNKIYEIDEAELGIGNQKVKVKPNYNDIQVAYKLWIELSTRKLGLPLDFNHDVIFEVYKSWYEFFKITRELLKEIPVSKMKNRSTIKIINLAIDVLNEALRPHLTKWQAKFIRWYNIELENCKGLDCTPQDIQRKYSHYNELISEMQEVNKKIISYRNLLSEIALQ